MINDKQHASLLEASLSKGYPKLRDSFPMNISRLENIFDLQHTLIKKMNNPSWRYEFVKEYTKSL